MLDEEVVLPRTTDDTYLRKLGERHERKHKRYQRPKGNASRTAFAVLHYAGVVTYQVKGFLQKNKDELSADLLEMLRSSSNPFVASTLFKDPDHQTSNPDKASRSGMGGGGGGVRNNRFKINDGGGGGGGGGGRAVGKIGGKKGGKGTVGSLFKKQVDDLMGALGKTVSRFIRCIKVR